MPGSSMARARATVLLLGAAPVHHIKGQVTCLAGSGAHLSQALDWSIQVHVWVLINLDEEAAQLLQGRLNNLGLLNTLHKSDNRTNTDVTDKFPHAFKHLEENTKSQYLVLQASQRTPKSFHEMLPDNSKH